ncbi:protein Wnt-11-like isoform X2 [Rhodnius prolixus]|uniref:protein Wnt-11-like isoform X2 n=1 Tax=Rhodnius prolixus TaxID=13249 RepID=UPI003D18A1F5
MRELQRRTDLERKIEMLYAAPYLVCAQSKFCAGSEMARLFTRASLQAKTVCKKLFINRAMSCQVASKEFINVTRETGFLYALMSSSVAHTIYRACLNGEIRCCTCSSPYVDHQRGRNKTLFWTTCACAIRTIMKTVIKQLGLVVSGKPRTLPAVSFAYRHNAIVGLETLNAAALNSCRCSNGSYICMKKSCWVIVPDYFKVASDLKKKYFNAIFVDLGNMNTMISHKLPKTTLIYLQESSEHHCKTISGLLCHNERICKRICCHGSFIVQHQRGRHFCNCKWISPHLQCETCDGAATIFYCL